MLTLKTARKRDGLCPKCGADNVVLTCTQRSEWTCFCPHCQHLWRRRRRAADKDSAHDRRDRSPRMLEGDIIVTAVAGHFALGRLTADLKTQAHLAVSATRTAALTQACELAGRDHQVFLYPTSHSAACLLFKCRPMTAATTGLAQSD